MKRTQFTKTMVLLIIGIMLSLTWAFGAPPTTNAPAANKAGLQVLSPAQGLEVTIPADTQLSPELVTDSPASLRATAKLILATAKAKAIQFGVVINTQAEALASRYEARADVLDATQQQRDSARRAAEGSGRIARAASRLSGVLPVSSEPAPEVVLEGNAFTARQAALWQATIAKYDRNHDGALSPEERARISVEDRQALRDAGL